MGAELGLLLPSSGTILLHRTVPRPDGELASILLILLCEMNPFHPL
jgi:hypothetical protein